MLGKFSVLQQKNCRGRGERKFAQNIGILLRGRPGPEEEKPLGGS